jgi:hypothetical protein
MNVGMDRQHRIRRRLLGAIALGGLIVGLVVGAGGGGSRRLVPGGGNADGTFDPLAYSSASASSLQAAAADGLSHVVYAKSPGGVLASAQRTAGFRAAVEAAARRGPIDADTLEAIVMLESAGRPDVIAGSDPAAASGLTQIVAQTGRSLLGMRIDLAASRRLEAAIAAALAAGQRARAAKLSTARARIDPRFDPRAALAATERYLALAKRIFGRDDLAIASYHMGIANLERALRLFTGEASEPIRQLVADQDLSYLKLYLDSTPISHPAAYGWLAAFGDDSETYLWRIGAARQIMSLYRADPARLAQQATLQTAAPSAEYALRPPSTPRFADRAALNAAVASGALVAVPSGTSADALGLRASGALLLRPKALAVALYLAAGTREIGRSTAPLSIVSATTDAVDQHAAVVASGGLAESDPVNQTGYAFDVARSYASHAQAEAFQFMLDRLQALDVIAWERGSQVIHIVAGPRADTLAGLRFDHAG